MALTGVSPAGPLVSATGITEQASAPSLIATLRGGQPAWRETALTDRLQVLKRFRYLLAQAAPDLAAMLGSSLSRTAPEAYTSEIIPLADAAGFLEHSAAKVLRPAWLSRKGRSRWLGQNDIVVYREPYGVVLIIGPSNYPLFLPGTQALQALVAGNAVLWKPGEGGAPVARLIQGLLQKAGLPPDLLAVSDESAMFAQEAVAAGVDKIVLTGSAQAGRAVLLRAAESLTPSVMELSGCDSFFVLPGCDLDRAAKALLFALSLNGGRTCIAPRRVFVHASLEAAFRPLLAAGLQKLEGVPVSREAARVLAGVREDAERQGASDLVPPGAVTAGRIRPTVMIDAHPGMRLMQEDVFAPVAAMMRVDSVAEAKRASDLCPYALGASIFASEETARRLAESVRAGVVVINDAVASTADPRLAFGGRGQSGFGKSRGADGLLEMTVAKSIVIQRARRLRHLEPQPAQALPIFDAYLGLAHGSGLHRIGAAARLCRAALGAAFTRGSAHRSIDKELERARNGN